MSADWSAPDQAPKPDEAASSFASRASASRGRVPVGGDRIDPALDAGEAGAGAGVLGATTAAEPADAAYETQPALPRRPRRGGSAAAAIAAGVAAAAILATIGWYVAQRHAQGLAQLTPGEAVSPPARHPPRR